MASEASQEVASGASQEVASKGFHEMGSEASGLIHEVAAGRLLRKCFPASGVRKLQRLLRKWLQDSFPGSGLRKASQEVAS